MISFTINDSACMDIIITVCFYVFLGKFHSHPYTLNKGVVLWFQQVFAIFVKHLYHATRFWPSVIWQIIVPLFFVILCLALAASKPGEDTNNAARLLSVKNTAPSKTITFFWANLGGVTSPIDFKVRK